MWQVDCPRKFLIEWGPGRGSWKLQAAVVSTLGKMVEYILKNGIDGVYIKE